MPSRLSSERVVADLELHASLRSRKTILPAESVIGLDAQDARTAAEIYRSLRQARSGEIDIAIAAVENIPACGCSVRAGFDRLKVSE